MKEVKQFSKSYILVSAVYIVLGGVLLAWPDTSLKMICYGLGFAMIVLGITYGIIFFTKEEHSGFLPMDLVIGIVCLAFGVFILLNPSFLHTVLPFAMGIILLLGAIVKIQNSVNMKRLRYEKWYLVLICAVAIIVLGIVLLCNIFSEEKYMVLYIGICLIFDGLTNMVSLLCIQLRLNKLAKLQKKIPGAQLEDLLEKKAKRNDSTGEAAVYESVPEIVEPEKEQE